MKAFWVAFHSKNASWASPRACLGEWVGGWVGWVEEKTAVGMSYFTEEKKAV